MGSSYGNINFSGFIFTSLIFFLINFHTNYHLASANDRYAYIVYMNKSQMPKVFTTHDQWYSYIIDYINATHRNTSESSPTLLYAYNNALHGFSGSISHRSKRLLRSEALCHYIQTNLSHLTQLTLRSSSLSTPPKDYGPRRATEKAS